MVGAGSFAPPPPTFLSRQINREDRVGGEGGAKLPSPIFTGILCLQRGSGGEVSLFLPGNKCKYGKERKRVGGAAALDQSFLFTW